MGGGRGRGRKYDNHKIYAFDGSTFVMSSDRKAAWYIAKNLADRIDEKTIKLRFEPKRRIDGKLLDLLSVEYKNCCATCGDNDELNRVHIIPHVYVKTFPTNVKNDLRLNVVRMCRECLSDWTYFCNIYIKDLLTEYCEHNQITIAVNNVYNDACMSLMNSIIKKDIESNKLNSYIYSWYAYFLKMMEPVDMPKEWHASLETYVNNS